MDGQEPGRLAQPQAPGIGTAIQPGTVPAVIFQEPPAATRCRDGRTGRSAGPGGGDVHRVTPRRAAWYSRARVPADKWT